MKSLNRTLSLVLVLVMVLGLIGVAGATDFKDDAKIKNEQAVQTASALNIINGKDDGNFDPEGIVTRGEMAKMICVALNGGAEPTLGTLATPTYTDIKGTWAEKYIEYCSGLAIVAGKGDGTFAPAATVTGTEAAKMLLVALGYISDYEGFTGAEWSVKVNTRAMQKGLYAELAIDPNAGLTRDNAAQMVYNALYAEMVEYSYGIAPGTGSTVSGVATARDTTDTMLTARYKLKENVTGKMEGIAYNKTTKEYTYTITGSASVTSKTDYSALYGVNVKVFYKDKTNNGYTASDDTVYSIVPKDSKVIASGNTGVMGPFNATDKTLKFGYAQTAYDVETTTPVATSGLPFSALGYASSTTCAAVTLYVGFDGTKKAAVIVPFGEAASFIMTTDGTRYDLGDVRLIDNNNDNKIDTVVVVPFTVEKVNGVSTTNAVLSGGTVALKDNNVYEGIAKNDIVAKYANTATATRTTTVVKQNVLSATVTGIKGASAGTQFQVNGIWMLPTSVASLGYFTNAVLPSIGDVVDYTMVGSLAPYVKVTTAGVGSNDIAVVLNAATTSGVGAGVEAKLYFADGTNKVVKVAKLDGTAVTTVAGLNGTAGKAVTYKVNSDGDYELATITTGNMAGYDNVAATESYNTTTKKAGVYTIADDAVVFAIDYKTGSASAMDNDNAMKMYTGKELKNSSFAGTLYVLAKDVSGFNTAKVVVVNQSGALSITKAANYGYLTADTYQTKEGSDSYLNYTIWNGTETVTAKYKTTDAPASYAKGAIVTYDTGDTGIIKNVKVLSSYVTAAVEGWDDAKTTGNITFAGNGTTYKINSDTVIIYANTKDKVGDTGSIQKAVGGDNNVKYTANSSDEVEFILVDVNQKIV